MATKTLDLLQQTEFDAAVKSAYQSKGGKLRDSVRWKKGIVAKEAKFRRSGDGIATPRVSGTDVVPMNTKYEEVTCSLEKWNAADYTDVFDQAEIDFQERNVVVNNAASAIGRREDQQIINALIASTTTLNVPLSAAGLTVEKLIEAARIMDDGEIPEEHRYFLGSSTGKAQLLNTTKVTNTDYASVKALVNGQVDSFMGFKFIWLGKRKEGGLPLSAGNVRTSFAFHGGDMGAVGMASGLEQRTEINYIPEKTAWLVNVLYHAGACTIDPAGIIEVMTQE